jgi:hypothetical protein
VLTYQSLTVWDRGADDEDVEDDATAALAEARRAAVRGEEGADLLDLLHPRGRELVARAAASGPWTLVLDECHHLLETWGALCRALVRALGEQTWVIGLTATPRTAMTERQAGCTTSCSGTATSSSRRPRWSRRASSRRSRSWPTSRPRRSRRTPGSSPSGSASRTSSWSC